MKNILARVRQWGARPELVEVRTERHGAYVTVHYYEGK